MSINEPIVIACASSNEFAMPLAVTMRSALMNAKPDNEIHLYVLDGNIHLARKQKVEQSLAFDNLKLFWIRPPEEKLAEMPVSESYPLPAYYRLLLPEIFPSNVKKAIYLDTDLIINGDLAELWQIEIGDYHALAVQDACQQVIKNAGGLREVYLPELEDCKYFNAGVMVINLEKWRQDDVTGQAINRIKSVAKDMFPDQDALNLVLAQKWGELSPQWNQIHALHEFQSWTDSPYDELTFYRALYNPLIVHFTTRPKPWEHPNCSHPLKALFFQYLDQTAWSGWRNTIWRRALRKVRTAVS